jgi:hypothetical protein
MVYLGEKEIIDFAFVFGFLICLTFCLLLMYINHIKIIKRMDRYLTDNKLQDNYYQYEANEKIKEGRLK